MKHALPFVFAAICFSLSAKAQDILPRVKSFDKEIDECPEIRMQVELLPHQIAVCDFICAGTVLSTNDGYSASLAVQEVVWGQTPTSNILVRCVDPAEPTGFLLNNKYLVAAYTNNWWPKGTKTHNHFDYVDETILATFDYNTPTSHPPDNAVFEDFRILSDWASTLNFDTIATGETNLWENTRTFITNFIDLAKIQHDETKVHKLVYDLAEGKKRFASGLPLLFRAYIIKYYWSRFKSWRIPPPKDEEE